MQVKVIGCSNSWSTRPNSCYCVNDTILVDCGAGVRKYFKKAKVDACKIKNIFVTHLHADHMVDLCHFINTEITYKTQEHRKTVTIYGPTGLYDILDFFIKTVALGGELGQTVKIRDFVNIVEITDFSAQIKVGELLVTPYKLWHGYIDDIAYVFDDGSVRVGFSGDCVFDDATQNFVKNIDGGFIDCYHKKTNKAHMGLEDFLKIKKQYPNKKLYAVHCDDEVYKNARRYKVKVAKASKQYKF